MCRKLMSLLSLTHSKGGEKGGETAEIGTLLKRWKSIVYHNIFVLWTKMEKKIDRFKINKSVISDNVELARERVRDVQWTADHRNVVWCDHVWWTETIRWIEMKRRTVQVRTLKTDRRTGRHQPRTREHVGKRVTVKLKRTTTRSDETMRKVEGFDRKLKECWILARSGWKEVKKLMPN